MQFAIENGVPIPLAKTGKKRGHTAKLVETMRTMLPGQSFFAFGIHQTRVTAAAAVVKPMRFTTRMFDDGTRVWRVE